MNLQIICVLFAVLSSSYAEPDDEEVFSHEEESLWDKRTSDVLEKIAETHKGELQHLERGDMTDEAASETRDRLKRNIAVMLYRLISVHPLGEGKKRVRTVFEKSPLKKFFFWVCLQIESYQYKSSGIHPRLA